jgi:hypothetical protein
MARARGLAERTRAACASTIMRSSTSSVACCLLPAPCCLCACCMCACRMLLPHAACAHAARAHVAVTCACLMLPTACCTCTCRCNVRRYENDGIFDKFRCSWSPDSRYFVTGSYSNLYEFLPPSLRTACSDVYICNHRRCRLHCMITSPKHSLRARTHVRRVHACVCNGRRGRMRLRHCAAAASR